MGLLATLGYEIRPSCHGTPLAQLSLYPSAIKPCTANLRVRRYSQVGTQAVPRRTSTGNISRASLLPTPRSKSLQQRSVQTHSHLPSFRRMLPYHPTRDTQWPLICYKLDMWKDTVRPISSTWASLRASQAHLETPHAAHVTNCTAGTISVTTCLPKELPPMTWQCNGRPS